MTWKSEGPLREGSQQRKISAPLSLKVSRSVSKTSGGTRLRDMNTFAPLNSCVAVFIVAGNLNRRFSPYLSDSVIEMENQNPRIGGGRWMNSRGGE